MTKAPKSEPASGDDGDATHLSAEQSIFRAQEDRIAELDRRVAGLSERIASAAAASSSVDAELIEQQNVQIGELQRLVGNLGERMTTVQAVNARDEQFNAAVRGVELASAAVQRTLVRPNSAVDSATRPQPAAAVGRECGCGPCECVSCACCTFEIWMSHVRVDQMQNPLIDVLPLSADSNLLPTGMMEVWMFASIDPINNIGVCIPDPSPTSYIPLHKQITDPYGPWVQVNRCVGTATVKKGVPLPVTVALTCVERETAADRLQPMNRDEWGSNTGTVTLDCCYSNYSPVDISVALTSWGQAGGAVTSRFIVVKRC